MNWYKQAQNRDYLVNQLGLASNIADSILPYILSMDKKKRSYILRKIKSEIDAVNSSTKLLRDPTYLDRMFPFESAESVKFSPMVVNVSQNLDERKWVQGLIDSKRIDINTDLPKIRDLLLRFNNLNSGRVISEFSDDSVLFDFVHGMTKKSDIILPKSGWKFLGEDTVDGIRVKLLMIDSKEAMEEIGKNTNWCVSHGSFTYYNPNVYYCFIIDEEPRVLVHPESRQIKDDSDVPLETVDAKYIYKLLDKHGLYANYDDQEDDHQEVEDDYTIFYKALDEIKKAEENIGNREYIESMLSKNIKSVTYLPFNSIDSYLPTIVENFSKLTFDDMESMNKNILEKIGLYINFYNLPIKSKMSEYADIIAVQDPNRYLKVVPSSFRTVFSNKILNLKLPPEHRDNSGVMNALFDSLNDDDAYSNFIKRTMNRIPYLYARLSPEVANKYRDLVLNDSEFERQQVRAWGHLIDDTSRYEDVPKFLKERHADFFKKHYIDSIEKTLKTNPGSFESFSKKIKDQFPDLFLKYEESYIHSVERKIIDSRKYDSVPSWVMLKYPDRMRIALATGWRYEITRQGIWFFAKVPEDVIKSNPEIFDVVEVKFMEIVDSHLNKPILQRNQDIFDFIPKWIKIKYKSRIYDSEIARFESLIEKDVFYLKKVPNEIKDKYPERIEIAAVKGWVASLKIGNSSFDNVPDDLLNKYPNVFIEYEKGYIDNVKEIISKNPMLFEKIPFLIRSKYPYIVEENKDVYFYHIKKLTSAGAYFENKYESVPEWIKSSYPKEIEEAYVSGMELLLSKKPRFFSRISEWMVVKYPQIFSVYEEKYVSVAIEEVRNNTSIFRTIPEWIKRRNPQILEAYKGKIEAIKNTSQASIRMNWYIRAAKEREYYHGTDSPPFDTYDPSKAKKGKPHYNPLGDAMYVTDKPDFARQFGEHVYPVKIPADAKIKRVSPSSAGSAIRDIIMRAMKRVGIDYHDQKAIPKWWEFAITLGKQLDNASYSPYDAIIESVATIKIYFPDKADAFGRAVSEIATKKFSKFDVVIFVGTNDPNAIFIGSTPTQEILIFNKAMQKVFSPQTV